MTSKIRQVDVKKASELILTSDLLTYLGISSQGLLVFIFSVFTCETNIRIRKAHFNYKGKSNIVGCGKQAINEIIDNDFQDNKKYIIMKVSNLQ